MFNLNQLRDIIATSQQFHKATLELEGRRGDGVIFPVIDTLVERLEGTKQLFI